MSTPDGAGSPVRGGVPVRSIIVEISGKRIEPLTGETE
jgi:hypothetical protein